MTLTTRMNRKRIPAYGKQFMEMRRSGKVPSKRVMVTFDWDLAKAYPRIVIADETPAAELNFSYLAGLAVQIVYRGKDAHRVNPLCEAIMEVKPSWLATFAMDLAATDSPAFTIIKPLDVQTREAA